MKTHIVGGKVFFEMATCAITIPRPKTQFESIQEVRKDGYPIVNEIISNESFKSNPKDANYDLPLSNLEKNYNG